MTMHSDDDLDFSNIGWKMLKGGGIACAVVFGPVLAIWILAVIGTYLPEDSRFAPDPTPNSFGLQDEG